MRVLLAYPEFRDPTFWSFKESLKIVGKKANMPPYGLISVAAMLPANYKLTLKDENIESITDKDIQDADLVLSSSMIVQKEATNDLIARCNRFGKPVIPGGPLINTGYKSVPGATSYFIGEAEQGFPSLINDFEQGRLKAAYGHVIDENKAAEIRSHFGNDISLLVGERPQLTGPQPRFDLLNLEAYGSMAVQGSRGCPVGCEFCDIWKQYGLKPRLKPVDKLTGELDALLKLGYTGGVFIVDDNFIGNKKQVKEELLPALARWQDDHGHPHQLYTEATITMADDEQLLTLMRNAGFNMVFVGIETPDEASLLETNKKLNTDYKAHNTTQKLLDQVRTIQQHGIEVSTGLIVGFDNEPANIAPVMAKFIQDAKIPMAMAGLLTALPETDLETRLEKEGRLHGASIGNNTHSFDLNFDTKRPRQDVIESYKTLIAALFDYDKGLKNYFERCDGMLDVMGYQQHGTRKVRKNDVKAFVSALKTILPTRYGWEFTKFLAKRAWKDPRTFAEAVALGIKGHHLAHITRGALEQQNMYEFLDDTRAKAQAYVQRLRESYEHGRAAVQNAYDHRHEILTDTRRRVQDAYAHKQEMFTDATHRVQDVYAHRQELLADARRRLRSMHKDTRERIQVRYDAFVADMNNLYRGLETQRIPPA